MAMNDRARPSSNEWIRDHRLARAIRDVEGGAPSRARLELLGARIVVAALVALERKRDGAWWEWMTRWARAEVAVATAAAILALAAGNLTDAWSGDAARSVAVSPTEAGITGEPLGTGRVDSVVARSLATGASSEQVMNALVGPANRDWLFTAAVTR
jgi:hypothetical protein